MSRTHGYKCILTSVKTGKQYEFKSGREASFWLGCSKSYVTTSVYNGTPIKDKNTGEQFICTYPDGHTKKANQIGKSEQLCCTCKNCYGGCSWSRDFTPVDGWDAIPTIIKQQWGKQIGSFAIRDCPLYERG